MKTFKIVCDDGVIREYITLAEGARCTAGSANTFRQYVSSEKIPSLKFNGVRLINLKHFYQFDRQYYLPLKWDCTQESMESWRNAEEYQG